jgi:hypothetical protein
MKKLLKSVLYCSLLFTTIANAQWYSKNSIKGNGKIITEKRVTADYDEIKIAGFFDVELVSGKEGNISIQGEENLLQYIKTETENGVLKVFTEKKSNISTNKKILITIPFENINAVSLSGSGNLSTKTTIKTNKFKTNLAGSGDITLTVVAIEIEADLSGSGTLILKGNTDSLMTKLVGSGDVNTADLKSKNADVSVTGSGDVTLNCSNNLKARVSGSGDIYYTGNPKTKDANVNGSGDITQK